MHQYDALGNRTKTTLPSGQVVAYQYNHQQLFTQVSLDDEVISQIQRDALGREVTKQQGKLNAHFTHKRGQATFILLLLKREILLPWSERYIDVK